MSIKGQGHFFTIYFPGFVCFVSGERVQDHWSSGFYVAYAVFKFQIIELDVNYEVQRKILLELEILYKVRLLLCK